MDGQSPEQVALTAEAAPAVKPSCFLGMPHSGQMTPETLFSLTNAGGKCRMLLAYAASSLLCHNFNQLWCQALNGPEEDKPGVRPEFFAMHHSDIAAPTDWLDVLLGELDATGATMVSAAVAIKDFRGLTSTALLDVQENKLRRLTVRELDELPETFAADDIARAWGMPEEDPNRFVLCVNTGLWVCRFGDWAETICFETGDRIEQRDGKFVPMVFPEDWLFSSTLVSKGFKVAATKKVPVIHFGRAPFATGGENKGWGRLTSDEWFPI